MFSNCIKGHVFEGILSFLKIYFKCNMKLKLKRHFCFVFFFF
uniref:Uncharacterized protein n=1 Tax=Anguilla anguilla TaxID=7936 RepID=A0A0E9URJ8_ANGAN